MADTTRLVRKLDEALHALKINRRRGDVDGSRLAEALRERFVAGRPFEVLIGGVPEKVRCDDVRISKTTVTLPCQRADGVIPLTRVTTCCHGQDADGNDITGFGLIEDDDRVTPLAFT